MKKDIAWNTFGNIFYGFCTWVITILVVRMGSFTDAGYLSLAMTTSSTYNAIALFAMRNYQITDSGHLYSDGEYVSSRIISCLAAYVFLAVAAVFSGSMYQAICIIAFMPVRLSEAYSDVFHGIDQMHDRYDLIGKSFTMRGIAVIVIFIAGMAVSGNLALTLGLISIATFAISILWDKRLTSKITTIEMRLKDSKILKLYLSCLPEVVGVTRQGIYASISNPTYAIQVMGAALFAPFLPVLAEYLKERDIQGFNRGVRKVTGILVVFSALVLVAASLLGRWVLGIFFGKEILDYYELFIPVVIVIIINTFVYWFQGVLVALRKNVLLAVGMIVDFMLFVILIRPAIEIFGMNGASYAQILSLGLYLLFEIIATAFNGKKIQE